MNGHHDVVVIGAGFSGLYAVHKMRNELGLSVRAFEAADGIGGTWWWNRYPGARCDFESVHYSYSFSDEIQREWEWTEKFAPQREIRSYLEWVADRLELRRSFQFGTRVESLTWDEPSATWAVRTSDGEVCSARYVVSCVGGLSHPKSVDFPGADLFTGELYRTSSWPEHEVDFAGKRVGVVGVGASGIQLVTAIAEKTGALTIFQRTPNFVGRLGNEPVAPEQRRWNAENHEQIRGESGSYLMGLPYDRALLPASAASPEERREVYDRYWERGGFSLLTSTFNDLLFNPESNETAAEYVRGKIREQVKDPATAQLLSPRDHPYATKRPPFVDGYYDIYNLPHVQLVDAAAAPIQEITETGIRTADATYEFDMIVLATGFDAFTGAQLAIPTIGRDGMTLQSTWQDGPRNYLGMLGAGFPNLFTIVGPLSAAGVVNTTMVTEKQVEFATALVSEMQSRHATTVEATADAEERWVHLCRAIIAMSLYSASPKSWHVGGNVEGKAVTGYTFMLGAPMYNAIIEQARSHGFAGLSFDGVATEVPPLVRLDPAAAVVVAGMLNGGTPPMEQLTPEMMRGLMDAMGGMQITGPDMRVEEIDVPRMRIYIPDSVAVEGAENAPVLIMYHGGGFVSGSLETLDPTCRRYADSLGAIVVSATYALAPEHPFPAGPDDAFAALLWVREYIGAYGGDADRIALMGESAGAHLAAVTAIRARDEQIPVAAQILMYPVIDPDADSPSRTELSGGPFLTAAACEKFWAMYLDGADITAQTSPNRTTSLAGLAPALVLTMELDLLHEEAENYADLLAAAGVTMEKQRFDGLFHGVFGMSAMIPRVQEIDASVATFFDRHVGSVRSERQEEMSS